MSSRSSLFLTGDNEHWYEETNQPHNDEAGKFAGFTIVAEFDKKNIRVIENDNDSLIIEIDPGSELYKKIMSLKE